MKKLTLIGMMMFTLMIIPSIHALETCKAIVEPTDIPCTITSAWNYTPPCNGYKALTYNSSGGNIKNFTFGNYGSSGLCSFNFNLTAIGSYTFTVSNGDTGQILVRQDNMQIGLIIGLAVTIGAFLFLAFKLDDSHGILKLVLIFFSIILLPVIPAVYIINTSSAIFYKTVLGFITVFWLYVAGYLIYWLLVKAGAVVPK